MDGRLGILTRYKIKLSVRYSLSVFGVFTVFAGGYFISQGWLEYYQVQQNLLNRMKGIGDILENKSFYLKQIDEGNLILQKILGKTLDNALILESGKNSYSFFSSPVQRLPLKDGFSLLNGYMYLTKEITFHETTYQIFVRNKFEKTPTRQFQSFLWILLLSQPFFLILWGLGYLMISKNFRLIEASIQALEDFTNHVNHELNTPLTEIISTLRLAQKTKKYPEAVEEALHSSKQLASMLKAIVTLSSISNLSYQKQRLDVNEELKSFLSQSTQSISIKNITLETEIDPNIFYIHANRENLFLCFGNLLSNALKYSYEGGKILVTWKGGIFSITDWGKGIDKHNLENIFKRYFREDYVSQAGSGIGLSLVKKIVDLNNWKIGIESEKGVGTRVWIDFRKRKNKDE